MKKNYKPPKEPEQKPLIKEMVVHLDAPNTLSAHIAKDQRERIQSLKTTGLLGKKDFDVLDDVCGMPERIYLTDDEDGDYIPDYSTAGAIRHLDLGEARYVDGDEMPYFGDDAPLSTFILPQGITSTFEKFEDGTGLSGSTLLKTIILPQGIRKVGNITYCPKLTNVVLPDSVEEIHSFFGCESLDRIFIPTKVNCIVGGAFGKCDIRAFEVSDDNLHFTVVDGVIFTKDLTTLVAFPPKYPHDSYTISCTTRTIGNGAFEGCDLRHIVLPEGLEVIGSSAFERCALESIDIPDSVTKIGSLAFRWCENLSHLGLPNGLKHIPEQMVCDCDKLKEVTIPASVRTYGKYAFYWCKSIKQFIVHEDLADPTKETIMNRKMFFSWVKMRTVGN